MIIIRFIHILMFKPASRSQNALAGIDSQGVLGSEPQSPRLREP